MDKQKLITLAQFVLVGAVFLLIPSSTSRKADRRPDENDTTDKEIDKKEIKPNNHTTKHKE